MPDEESDDRNDDGGSDDDDVEHVPELLEELRQSEGVKFCGDLDGEDGQEESLAAVEIKADEDGVAEDGHVEEVPIGAMKTLSEGR